MAGGPNATAMLCLTCLGKAVRIAEGIETDQYRCEQCGAGFGIDWRRGPPAQPTWPPSAEEMAAARILQEQRRARGSPGGPAS
jgi:hypothetical protein